MVLITAISFRGGVAGVSSAERVAENGEAGWSEGKAFPFFYYVTFRRLLRFLITNDILFTCQIISAQEAMSIKKSDFLK